MNRPDPLQPAYDFSQAPEPVVLLQGPVEVHIGDDILRETADLILQFSPTPRLIFRTIIVNPPRTLPPRWMSMDPDNSFFSFNGVEVEAFCVRKTHTQTFALALDWCARQEPIAPYDMQSRTTVHAIYHLFNFTQFWGGKHQNRAPEWCSLMMLESEDWRFSIQALPDGGTYKPWKRIREDDGCFLTHMLKMERKDGASFSGQDASEQHDLLSAFLSFVKGGSFAPVCGVGFDALEARTWATYTRPGGDQPARSWFTHVEASQAEDLFPLFARRWRQSDEWRACLYTSIYWYVQANKVLAI